VTPRAKISEAQVILKTLGLPTPQQNRISALTLLALCGLKVDEPWRQARREGRTVTKGLMEFMHREYSVRYAPNTRETVRRQVLHQLVLAGVADRNPFDPELPTNDPRTHYAISEAALNAVRTFGSKEWETEVARFLTRRTALIEIFARERSKRLIPVRFPDGKLISLSPGAHNRLQKAIVEQFAPRFAERPKAFISRRHRPKEPIHSW
jgi:type II restriction enzyme